MRVNQVTEWVQLTNITQSMSTPDREAIWFFQLSKDMHWIYYNIVENLKNVNPPSRRTRFWMCKDLWHGEKQGRAKKSWISGGFPGAIGMFGGDGWFFHFSCFSENAIGSETFQRTQYLQLRGFGKSKKVGWSQDETFLNLKISFVTNAFSPFGIFCSCSLKFIRLIYLFEIWWFVTWYTVLVQPCDRNKLPDGIPQDSVLRLPQLRHESSKSCLPLSTTLSSLDRWHLDKVSDLFGPCGLVLFLQREDDSI